MKGSFKNDKKRNGRNYHKKEHKKMELSEKLLNFRAEKNLSQKQAAEMFGVTIAMFQRWEQGKAFPTKKNLLRIEKIIEK